MNNMQLGMIIIMTGLTIFFKEELVRLANAITDIFRNRAEEKREAEEKDKALACMGLFFSHARAFLEDCIVDVSGNVWNSDLQQLINRWAGGVYDEGDDAIMINSRHKFEKMLTIKKAQYETMYKEINNSQNWAGELQSALSDMNEVTRVIYPLLASVDQDIADKVRDVYKDAVCAVPFKGWSPKELKDFVELSIAKTRELRTA